jgi:hypothetical protein
LVEPRVEHEIGQLAEEVEPRAAHCGGDKGLRPVVAHLPFSPIDARIVVNNGGIMARVIGL